MVYGFYYDVFCLRRSSGKMNNNRHIQHILDADRHRMLSSGNLSILGIFHSRIWMCQFAAKNAAFKCNIHIEATISEGSKRFPNEILPKDDDSYASNDGADTNLHTSSFRPFFYILQHPSRHLLSLNNDQCRRIMSLNWNEDVSNHEMNNLLFNLLYYYPTVPLFIYLINNYLFYSLIFNF